MINLIDYNKNIGIEIEVEQGIHTLSPIHRMYWKDVAEPSVRDNGLELVTICPIKGDRILEAIELINPIIMHSNFTSRCGLHIHVDVRDLFVGDICSLLIYNLLFEKYIFYGLPLHRYFSPFAPSCDTELNIEHSLKAIKNQNLDTILYGKYKSINYCNVNTIGTVEYRQFDSRGDKKHILEYINRCLAVVKYSRENTLKFEDLYDFVGKSMGDINTLVKIIFNPFCLNSIPDTQLHNMCNKTKQQLTHILVYLEDI